MHHVIKEASFNKTEQIIFSTSNSPNLSYCWMEVVEKIEELGLYWSTSRSGLYFHVGWWVELITLVIQILISDVGKCFSPSVSVKFYSLLELKKDQYEKHAF